MKKEEKQQIYNLLKLTDSYINGYTTKPFQTEITFCDDIIKTNNTQKDIYNQNENINNKQENHNPPKLTLNEINAKISKCTRCLLSKTRNNVVCGQGVENPQVLVIGEGPGYDEDMQGLPFVGNSGKLLDKMLAAIQLSRNTNCYIANIVKCRPPENRNPNNEEMDSCFSFLEAQIHILKPKMILCMGLIAGQKLLKIEEPMSEIHGKLYEYNYIPTLITYHPSALLRNEDLKRPAWNDLKILRKKLDELL